MYARYPGYLPYPTALQRAPGPVPNRNAIDNGGGNFANPEYLPAGSASFIPYVYNDNPKILGVPSNPVVLYSGTNGQSNVGLSPAVVAKMNPDSYGRLSASKPSRKLQHLLKYSREVLEQAVALQRLPPADAAQAVQVIYAQAAKLEQDLRFTSGANEKAMIEHRLVTLQQIAHVATTAKPVELNAAVAAKLIADHVENKRRVIATRDSLNLYSGGFNSIGSARRNPVFNSSLNELKALEKARKKAQRAARLAQKDQLTAHDIEKSALLSDLARVNLANARLQRRSMKIIKKLKKEAALKELEHVKTKIKFITQQQTNAQNKLKDELNEIDSPVVTGAIFESVREVPDNVMMRADLQQLLPDIIPAARQELIRRASATGLIGAQEFSMRANPCSSCGGDHGSSYGAPEVESYGACLPCQEAAELTSLQNFAGLRTNPIAGGLTWSGSSTNKKIMFAVTAGILAYFAWDKLSNSKDNSGY